MGILLAGPVAGQSIADEVNAGLPNWLQFGGLFRTRYEGFFDRGLTPGENDVHLLNRLRLDLRLRATRWLQFMFEGQDARIYLERSVPNVPPFANPMDLRLGYLQLGDTDKSTVSLRVGRQDLIFGEQR